MEGRVWGMTEENPYSYLVGRRVLVIWTDRPRAKGCDWIAFRILDAGVDSLWLQGVNDPSGARHDGSKCYAKLSDIREISVWKEGE